MPFRSRAQRRKFAQLLVEGKITDEAYERWNRDTGRKELPERVKPKTNKSRTIRKRTTAKRTTKKRKQTTKKRKQTTRKR